MYENIIDNVRKKEIFLLPIESQTTKMSFIIVFSPHGSKLWLDNLKQRIIHCIKTCATFLCRIEFSLSSIYEIACVKFKITLKHVICYVCRQCIFHTITFIAFIEPLKIFFSVHEVIRRV